MNDYDREEDNSNSKLTSALLTLDAKGTRIGYQNRGEFEKGEEGGNSIIGGHDSSFQTDFRVLSDGVENNGCCANDGPLFKIILGIGLGLVLLVNYFCSCVAYNDLYFHEYEIRHRSSPDSEDWHWKNNTTLATYMVGKDKDWSKLRNIDPEESGRTDNNKPYILCMNERMGCVDLLKVCFLSCLVLPSKKSLVTSDKPYKKTKLNHKTVGGFNIKGDTWITKTCWLLFGIATSPIRFIWLFIQNAVVCITKFCVYCPCDACHPFNRCTFFMLNFPEVYLWIPFKACWKTIKRICPCCSENIPEGLNSAFKELEDLAEK